MCEDISKISIWNIIIFTKLKQNSGKQHLSCMATMWSQCIVGIETVDMFISMAERKWPWLLWAKSVRQESVFFVRDVEDEHFWNAPVPDVMQSESGNTPVSSEIFYNTQYKFYLEKCISIVAVLWTCLFLSNSWLVMANVLNVYLNDFIFLAEWKLAEILDLSCGSSVLKVCNNISTI